MLNSPPQGELRPARLAIRPPRGRLALTTLFETTRALAIVGGAWATASVLAFLMAARAQHGMPSVSGHYLALDPLGQLVLAALAVADVATIAARHDALTIDRTIG